MTSIFYHLFVENNFEILRENIFLSAKSLLNHDYSVVFFRREIF